MAGPRSKKSKAEKAVESRFVLHEHQVNGRSFEWCAAQLGVSQGTAYNRYLEACRQLIGEDAPALVQASTNRLLSLINGAIEDCSDEDPRVRIQARLSVVRIDESLRKLLGLDQPTQIAGMVTVQTPQDLAIDALLDQHEAAIAKRERALATS